MIARRIAVVLVGISTCLDGPAAPAGEVESGLKPGATAGAFYVEDVTGPRAGTSLCYACAFAKRAVVNVQTTALTEELGRLLKLLDRHVDDPGRLARDSRHAFLVYLTEDPDSAIDELAAFAERHDLVNVPLTFYDELTGPPSYELSADAEVTVMMWVDTKVTVNHAFGPGELDAAAVDAVWADARTHLAVPDVPVEVRSLADLDEALRTPAGKVVVLDLWALW